MSSALQNAILRKMLNLGFSNFGPIFSKSVLFSVATLFLYLGMVICLS